MDTSLGIWRIHHYLLVVAHDKRESVAKGKQQILAHRSEAHVDDCLPIDEIAVRYMHLVEGAHPGLLIVMTTSGPLMIEILKGFGAKCYLFQTADDALMHVLGSRGSCGLLITDHGVPGQIQGAELAEMFRGKWLHVPVVLTSGYELHPATLPSGVVYLQKPWSIDSLIEILASICSRISRQPCLIASRPIDVSVKATRFGIAQSEFWLGTI